MVGLAWNNCISPRASIHDLQRIVLTGIVRAVLVRFQARDSGSNGGKLSSKALSSLSVW